MTALVSIPSRAGFLAARDSGVKAVAAGFVLQAAPTGRDNWRLGLTASKKTGNAVRRNRARRRLRALARTELAKRARPGTDYVMIARKARPSGRGMILSPTSINPLDIFIAA